VESGQVCLLIPFNVLCKSKTVVGRPGASGPGSSPIKPPSVGFKSIYKVNILGADDLSSG
jgi:hypothetical protein